MRSECLVLHRLLRNMSALVRDSADELGDKDRHLWNGSVEARRQKQSRKISEGKTNNGAKRQR